jgi:hypothetical protein
MNPEFNELVVRVAQLEELLDAITRSRIPTDDDLGKLVFYRPTVHEPWQGPHPLKAIYSDMQFLRYDVGRSVYRYAILGPQIPF